MGKKNVCNKEERKVCVREKDEAAYLGAVILA